MDRSDFFKLSAGTILCGGMIPLLQSCSPFQYVDAEYAESFLVVDTGHFSEQSSVLVKNPGSPAPILLTRFPDATYLALSLRCTHKGCTINPDKQVLECPCHGSRFTYKGKRLDGPARDDLHRFPLTEESGKIHIHLSNNHG